MSDSTNQTSTTKNKNLVPILIIAGLFFIFGFVTWINGALIPFMKTINELTDDVRLIKYFHFGCRVHLQSIIFTNL